MLQFPSVLYWKCSDCYVHKNNNNTTTTVLQPFVHDYPGEPVPEETLAHPSSRSSSNLYQLLSSTTIHSILPVQITCLVISLHNLLEKRPLNGCSSSRRVTVHSNWLKAALKWSIMCYVWRWYLRCLILYVASCRLLKIHCISKNLASLTCYNLDIYDLITIVFSERELMFTFTICCCPSICCLSVVSNVRAPYSGGSNFRSISIPFDLIWCW